GGEQRLKLLSLRDQRRRSRSDQSVDQILLPRSRLQDRRIGQDCSESRFAPDQAFICREEEGPVFPDRTTEGEAGLVALERRITPLYGGERGWRGGAVVAVRVVECSVDVVG